MKLFKYLLPFFITFMLYSAEYYESKIPGVPIGGGKVVGGLYNKITHKCIVSPIDDSKERLVVQGYSRLTKGLTIALLAFVCGLAFSNPLTHSLSNIGLGLGGFLSLDGLLKIFVAEYLTYFCWGAFLLVIFIIIMRLRKRSILNIGKWVRSLKNATQ